MPLHYALLIILNRFYFLYFFAFSDDPMPETEEPLDAHGNHMGFEIHHNPNGYGSERRSGGGSGGANRNSNGNHHNKPIYNSNGFYLADGSGINMENSDYSDDRYFEASSNNAAANSGSNKRHR